MPKTGRNDPCGSGKKYKHCCLNKDQAAEHATLTAKRAELDAQRAGFDARIEGFWTTLPDHYDQLDEDSNAVVDLIHAGRLDEAERAARQLLVRYPEVHDGYDRLGMICQARGQNREAADFYRKILVDFVRPHPENYDPAFEANLVELIAKLDGVDRAASGAREGQAVDLQMHAPGE
jgi:tetratricopeptide (TPR) repeat protein